MIGVTFNRPGISAVGRRIRKQNLLRILAVIFVIYSTDSLFFRFNTNSVPRQVSWACICMIGAYASLICLSENVRSALVAVVMTIVCGMLVNLNFSGGYIFKMLLLFCGAFFCDKIPWKEMKKYYVNVMLVIAVASLICCVFHSWITRMEFIPVISNGALEFRNLIVSIVPISDADRAGSLEYRNYGIFWEPGVYQIYLALAAVFCLFKGSERVTLSDGIKAVVFIVTVITTFSTTGYIVIAIILFAFFLEWKDADVRKGFFIAGIVAAVIMMCYIDSVSEILEFVFKKFRPGNSAISSTNARVYSALADLSIMPFHPFGLGPHKYDVYIKRYVDAKGIAGFSTVNVFLDNFVLFGWVYGSYYAYKLWRFIKSFHVSVFAALLLYLAVVLCLFSESLTYSLMFSFFIFYDEAHRVIIFRQECPDVRRTGRWSCDRQSI